MSLIHIESNRYTRVKRDDALNMLERANLTPDKFTAHRDRTFTARYQRDRAKLFRSLAYEDRMEDAAHHSIAIFKRPTREMDRGRYITLRFGFVATERLGLHVDATKNGHGPADEKPDSDHLEIDGDLAMFSRLMGITRDMKQLTQYAQDLSEKETIPHQPLKVTLKEMQHQINLLADGLHQLLREESDQ